MSERFSLELLFVVWERLWSISETPEMAIDDPKGGS
jgi:hypothetical protein